MYGEMSKFPIKVTWEHHVTIKSKLPTFSKKAGSPTMGKLVADSETEFHRIYLHLVTNTDTNT